jgi:hypothetical protein
VRSGWRKRRRMCWRATAGFKRWKGRGAATNEKDHGSPKAVKRSSFPHFSIACVEDSSSEYALQPHCNHAGVKRRQCQRTTSRSIATRCLNRSMGGCFEFGIRRITNARAHADFPRCVTRQFGSNDAGRMRSKIETPSSVSAHVVDECCEMKQARGLSRILHDLFAGTGVLAN